MNADSNGGKSGEQLLKDYGIDMIVMDGFDSVSGQAYLPAGGARRSLAERMEAGLPGHPRRHLHAQSSAGRDPLQVARRAGRHGAAMRVLCAERAAAVLARAWSTSSRRIGDRERYDKVGGDLPSKTAAPGIAVHRREEVSFAHSLESLPRDECGLRPDPSVESAA